MNIDLSDPDYAEKARYVKNAYHGYPYVHPVSWIDPATIIMRQTEEMVDWCRKNCRGKWRSDWQYVVWDHLYKTYAIDLHGPYSGMRFFAFKDEADYLWFTLKWN